MTNKTPPTKRTSNALELSKKEIETAGQKASKEIDKHISKKLKNFQDKDVQRLIGSWVAIMGIVFIGLIFQTRGLSTISQKDAGAEGGSYSEGVLGDINNISPIYAQTLADKSIANLVFDGLFAYGDQGELEPRLASDFSTNEDGDIYTVTLKDNIYWHDGEKLDAQDIAFTYELIKHPDSGSPLSDDWQDVKVQAKDDNTVTFALPNPYTPFPHSLTNGIVPYHLLSEIPPAQMRTASFNVEPIGTGPFKFSQIIVEDDVSSVEMIQNDGYFNGKPILDEFIVTGYETQEELLESFESGDVNAVYGLQKDKVAAIERQHQEVIFPTSSGVFLFMNNTRDITKDTSVRRSVTRGIQKETISSLLGDSGITINSPLLQSQIQHDDSYHQLPFDQEKAREDLDARKWELDEQENVRKKGDDVLELELVTQDTEEFLATAEEIKKQLANIGVRININAVSGEVIQQNHVIPHNYDLLLFGIDLGADPDVFVYWHSSQIGRGGFNFSDYESDEVDVALEAGRTRSNEKIREAKYLTFLKEWRADAPAVALYQDNEVYITAPSVRGVEPTKLNEPSHRLNNVPGWTLNTRSINNLQ